MALPSRIGLAFAAAFIVAPSIASAIPLEYGLNASTTLNGVTEQITGSFGFDSESTVTGAPGCCTQHGTQFSLIGPAPYAGIYVHSLDGAAANEIIGDNPIMGLGIFLFITFANDLSAADDPLKSVRWVNQNAPFEFAVDDSPTGFAACGGTFFPPFESCAAAVPEPASLGLLGIALGLLCAIRPVHRHVISSRVLNPIRPGTPTPERALTL